jgi:hypothetical protein
MIDFNLVILDLENSDIAAVTFEGAFSKYSFLQATWTPLT